MAYHQRGWQKAGLFHYFLHDDLVEEQGVSIAYVMK
jgi:hypothetical protein